MPEKSCNCDTAISGDVTVETIQVDSSFVAGAALSGDGNQPGQVITLTESRTDQGWTIGGNQASYAGDPHHVRIDAMAFYDPANNGGLQRISPELQLLRNGVVVAWSNTGYQRHAGNHNSSSNTISYTDTSPGTNPIYTLVAQQGSGQNDVLPITLGHMSMTAVEKLGVVTSVLVEDPIVAPI